MMATPARRPARPAARPLPSQVLRPMASQAVDAEATSVPGLREHAALLELPTYSSAQFVGHGSALATVETSHMSIQARKKRKATSSVHLSTSRARWTPLTFASDDVQYSVHSSDGSLCAVFRTFVPKPDSPKDKKRVVEIWSSDGSKLTETIVNHEDWRVDGASAVVLVESIFAHAAPHQIPSASRHGTLRAASLSTPRSSSRVAVIEATTELTRTRSPNFATSQRSVNASTVSRGQTSSSSSSTCLQSAQHLYTGSQTKYPIQTHHLVSRQSLIKAVCAFTPLPMKR